ncbi:sigma-54-dependent Fis family transcriptional regulator [Geobacter argillaceus]|nr:sigma-54-dependent Fis family transcriptional regulator [Geobacter argillaceus]
MQQSTKRTANQENDSDLHSLVHFCAGTGQIWLHEHRMLLVHADAQAALREELIETLGIDRAKGILIRMGYASGVRDVEVIRTCGQSANSIEDFTKGPQFHTLEGIVKSTPLKLEYDPVTNKFYAEDLWENSWEGQWHQRQYGIQSEPVCWSQVGYACGYASAFFGRPILYKEVECVGKGDNCCRIIGKPIEEWEDAAEYTRLFNRVSIAEQLIDLQTQVIQLRSAITENEKLPSHLVSVSKGFCAAYGLLTQAAEDSTISVLLLGETGVGKEVFARSLHDMSVRCDAPFVAINCAAIPHDLVESELFGVEKGAYTGAVSSRPGRFERANGGTLFLDEIGDLPLPAQAKLLRVLQEGEIERLGDHKTRKVNVRLVAATNIDLRLLVKEGKFRSDLYYRLNAFQINIPPLRERKEDVLPLAEHFMEKYSAVRGKKLRGFTDKAKRALLAYQWPGNVRELQNMIERAVILAQSGTRIEVDQVFSSYNDDQAMELGLDRDGSLGAKSLDPGNDVCEAILSGAITLDQIEARVVKAAVEKAKGNLSAAARALGLTRSQIAYRMERLQQNQEDRP